MLQQTLCRITTLAVLLSASTAVRGQEPTPVKIMAAPLAETGALNLVLAWRYHPGDDPRWADPAFEDTGWELVEPLRGEREQSDDITLVVVRTTG